MSSAEWGERAGQFRQTKLVVLWALLIVLGYAAMVSYSVDASLEPALGAHFPPPLGTGSALIYCHPKQLTLITFLHPQCPCSKATVSELEALLSQKHITSNLKAYAVISRPKACSDDFVKGAIYDSVSAIKGVQVVIDRGDLESERFGAKVSGQTLLFDDKGDCLFSGGITSARGEVGANAGAEALNQLLLGKRATIATTPVFGCSLESNN